MRFLATVQQGVYYDEEHIDQDGIHHELLDNYYNRNQTSDTAGFGDVRQSLHEVLTADQQEQVRHAPVDVPDHSSPFPSADIDDLFRQALADAEAEELIPDNMLVTMEEWPEGYPTHEAIASGIRSGKKLAVALPFAIWWPRAVRWAQAVQILEQFLQIANVQ